MNKKRLFLSIALSLLVLMVLGVGVACQSLPRALPEVNLTGGEPGQTSPLYNKATATPMVLLEAIEVTSQMPKTTYTPPTYAHDGLIATKDINLIPTASSTTQPNAISPLPTPTNTDVPPTPTINIQPLSILGASRTPTPQLPPTTPTNTPLPPTPRVYPTTNWQPPTLLSKEAMVDWVLYVDEVAGFSFKYPPDAKFFPVSKSANKFHTVHGYFTTPDSPLANMAITIVDNSKNVSLKQYLIKGHSEQLPTYLDTMETIEINQITGIWDKGNPHSEVLIVLGVEDRIFVFYADDAPDLGGNRQLSPLNKDLFYQMISTFMLLP